MEGTLVYSEQGKINMGKMGQGEEVLWQDTGGHIVINAAADIATLDDNFQESVVETLTHEAIHALVKHGLFTNISDPKELLKAVSIGKQGKFYDALEKWRKEVAKAYKKNPLLILPSSGDN